LTIPIYGPRFPDEASDTPSASWHVIASSYDNTHEEYGWSQTGQLKAMQKNFASHILFILSTKSS
jgi:hypothetical protein